MYPTTSKLSKSEHKRRTNDLPLILKKVPSKANLPDHLISKILFNKKMSGKRELTDNKISKILFLLIYLTALEVLIFLRDLFNKYSKTIFACNDKLLYREDLILLGINLCPQFLHKYFWYLTLRSLWNRYLNPSLTTDFELHFEQFF